MTSAGASIPRDIEIGEVGLAVEDVEAVARGRARVTLAPQACARIRAARQAVDRALARGDAVYGLNTGLGAAVDTPLGADEIAAFQQRAVRARAVGVGPFMSTDEVRALLFARVAGMAQGASGASPEFAAIIIAMLNAGAHPRVRRIGSLGEADLSHLAQAFLPLTGGGEVEWRGRILPGAEAMAAAGLVAPAFAPKDGLALLNANAASVGAGALALVDLARAVEASTVAGALSLEGFRANLSPIDARFVALRPAPGQEEGARRLRVWLAGSDLFEPGTARRVQDPLSFRCLAPVNGAAFAALAAARRAVEIELNGAGDSPAVLVEDDIIRSTVNFDTTALALSFEGAGLACAHAAAIAAFRVMKLMSPHSSGLPRFLTRRGASHSGFATAQKTAAVLEAEIRRLSQPLGAMAAPVADGVEDYAPMTPSVIDKSAAIAARLTRLAAIELVVASEAADQRGLIRLGAGSSAARAFVRAHVAALEDDRPMGGEFEALAERIAAGEFAAAVAAATPA